MNIHDGYGVERIDERFLIENCDADGGSYMTMDGYVVCRCIICERCGHHTGNAHQGHFWSYCKVTGDVRDFHMCCPDDCELEAS